MIPREESRALAGARQVAYTYDAAGRLDTLTEPVTGSVAFDYDEVGRITSIIQPDAHTVGFDYDLDGNLTKLTTPSGKEHSFGYNELGLNTSYTTPLGAEYLFEYDKDRRLTSVTFPTAEEISYSYWLGRLASITEPGGVVTSLAYDAAGRLATLAKGAQSVTFTYDGSLPTSVTYAGGLVNQTISTTYNADFLPSSVTYAGGTANYLYDNDGLLTQAGAFTIVRDTETGRPTSVYDTATTLMTVTPSYNAYGEVTGAVTTVNSIGVASWDVTYDDAGRIAAKTETVGGTTSTYAYTYDAMSRLETVKRNGITVEEYMYDGQGRRHQTDENYPSRTISGRIAQYDDDDRLWASGLTGYEFNDDGFLTSKTESGVGATTYTYAKNGQLNSVQLPSGTLIEYVYNAAGQRVAKKVNDVITEKYLWAGITGLLAVYDADNNLLMRFEGAKMVKGGQIYYLITDQVGTVRAVCDASGNIVKEITYDSFGNILDDTNETFTIPLGFAGGLHDRDTGLVRFGFRDYDPDSGTWTAKDPVLFASGDIYLYEYCSSDPINRADPTGEMAAVVPVLELLLNPEVWVAAVATCAVAADAAEGLGSVIVEGVRSEVNHAVDNIVTNVGIAASIIAGPIVAAMTKPDWTTELPPIFRQLPG